MRPASTAGASRTGPSVMNRQRVLPVARSFADDPSDPAARLEALRVLASDPESVERFATLLSDVSQPDDVRTLAATALSSLDRTRLRAIAAELREARTRLESAVRPDIEIHVDGLLDLPE